MSKTRPTELGDPYPNPPVRAAPVKAWSTRDRHYILWHGTTAVAVADIQRDGIDLSRCQRRRDFGRGLYTTTYETQARQWAGRAVRRSQRDQLRRGLRIDGRNPRGAIIGFPVPLDTLPAFHSLPFVRPEPDNELFWSFVQHCRGFAWSDERNPNHYPDPPEFTHHYPHPDGRAMYDLVCGPVAKMWGELPQVFLGYDQFSFHTPAAVAVLNALLPKAKVEIFEVQ